MSDDTGATIQLYTLFDRPEPVNDDYVFLTEDGRQLKGRRIQAIFQGLGKEAGIKRRLSPHKLRHSYATLALKNGAMLLMTLALKKR